MSLPKEVSLHFISAEDGRWYSGSLYDRKWKREDTPPLQQYKENELHIGKAIRLGSAELSSWEFKSGFWAFEGLKGKESKTGKKIWLALETPFVRWHVQHVTHLPGDKVLFQLGKKQICIYDPEERQIALLAQGHAPLATLLMKKSAY